MRVVRVVAVEYQVVHVIALEQSLIVIMYAVVQVSKTDVAAVVALLTLGADAVNLVRLDVIQLVVVPLLMLDVAVDSYAVRVVEVEFLQVHVIALEQSLTVIMYAVVQVSITDVAAVVALLMLDVDVDNLLLLGVIQRVVVQLLMLAVGVE